MSSLILFLDTEGGQILRNGKVRSPLYDVTFLIAAEGVIQEDLSIKVVNTFNPSFIQYTNIQEESKPKVICSNLAWYLKAFDCDGFICLSWKAHYDKKVLNPIFQEVEKQTNAKVHWYCLLKWAKLVSNNKIKIPDFSLNSLLSRYHFAHKQQHKSFQDVLDMISICHMIMKEAKKDKEMTLPPPGRELIALALILRNHHMKESIITTSIIVKKETVEPMIDANYDFIGNYKIRKGWEVNSKNKGLYELKEEKWVSIRGEQKEEILNKLLKDIPTAREVSQEKEFFIF